MGNGKRTTTSQLASPAAYTRRAVLQVTLSDLPVMTTSGSVPPSARRKALSQASLFWQTLQPTPPHPLSQVHPPAVRFPLASRGVSGRCGPWKMSPPQAGCEQFEPPKPTGQMQPELFERP